MKENIYLWKVSTASFLEIAALMFISLILELLVDKEHSTSQEKVVDWACHTFFKITLFYKSDLCSFFYVLYPISFLRPIN